MKERHKETGPEGVINSSSEYFIKIGMFSHFQRFSDLRGSQTDLQDSVRPCPLRIVVKYSDNHIIHYARDTGSYYCSRGELQFPPGAFFSTCYTHRSKSVRVDEIVATQGIMKKGKSAQKRVDGTTPYH